MKKRKLYKWRNIGRLDVVFDDHSASFRYKPAVIEVIRHFAKALNQHQRQKNLGQHPSIPDPETRHTGRNSQSKSNL